MNSVSPPRSVAIIGGGCSGLAAAHRLRELAPDVRVCLFESSSRVGGSLRTERSGDYLLEYGADMFTTKDPWAIDLCRRIGFDGELINTNKKYARAFVIHRGGLCPVPDGFALMTPGKAWPIVRSPLLSLRGKIRMACEYFVPRRENAADESLADFATRRLGLEAYERLVQPLVSGIYTADPTKLSMRAALPQFVEMERLHGGLIRAMARTGSHESRSTAAGARYGLFVAPRDGMQSFVDRVAQQLPQDSIRLQSTVLSLTPRPTGGWSVTVRGGGPPEPFDAAILATPAYRAADLAEAADAPLAGELRAIPYASSALVICGYRRDQVRHPLDGFGVVAPLNERRRILAASFSSVKFAGRAPQDRVLIRVFIGGACQPELVQLADHELQSLATGELAELLKIQGTPELSRVVRWERAMPQYHVGHDERVARIEHRMASLPTLALAGNAYHGVGIPHCIHSGERAAEKILAGKPVDADSR